MRRNTVFSQIMQLICQYRLKNVLIAMIYYLLLSFIKYQTKCRHSLHELTRIIGELLLDNTHSIEFIGVPLNFYAKVKRNQMQLSLF